MYTTYPRDTRKNNVVGKEDKAGQNTEHMTQTSLDNQLRVPEEQNDTVV